MTWVEESLTEALLVWDALADSIDDEDERMKLRMREGSGWALVRDVSRRTMDETVVAPVRW